MKKVNYILLAILISSSIAFTLKNDTSGTKEVKSLSKSFGHVPLGDVNIDGEEKSVPDFYISKTEVTNKEYQEFLNDLKENGDNEKYELAKFDSSGWLKVYDNKLEAYATYYHKHTAYQAYPAVNVSKEGAKLYCEWLTKKTNNSLPKDKQVQFRLPLKTEWLRAAEGTNSEKIYTWEGQYLRNSEGLVLANFANIQESAVSRNMEGDLVILKELPTSLKVTNSKDIIAPSESYFPNEFGLFNLNGNVSEILADSDEVIGGSWYDGGFDIRNRSTKKYDGASPMVGLRIVTTSIQ